MPQITRKSHYSAVIVSPRLVSSSPRALIATRTPLTITTHPSANIAFADPLAMSQRRKRSILPRLSVDDPHSALLLGEVPRKRRLGVLSLVFTWLRRATNSSASKSDLPLKQATDNSIVLSVTQEPLDDVAILVKKLRLSIVPPTLADEIPRLLVLMKRDMYTTYYNLKTRSEDEHNDLERRLSTAYGSLLKRPPPVLGSASVMAEVQGDVETDDGLPIPDISQLTGTLAHLRQPLVIIHSLAMPVEELDQASVVSLDDDYGLMVYADDEGNLVRPPFINVDPRERYQILQMKRQIDTVHEYQGMMRYMQNPNETKLKITKNNKVETATQTHDVDNLYRSLHFARRRQQNQANGTLKGDFSSINVVKSTSDSTTTGTRRQRRKPLGCYGIKYDPVKKPLATKGPNSLDGYLGRVSKPKFTDKKTGKSLLSGPQRDPKLLSKREVPTLDADYLEKLKQAEAANAGDEKLEATPATTTKPVSAPSAAFKFGNPSASKTTTNTTTDSTTAQHKIALPLLKPEESITTEAKLTPSFLFGKPLAPAAAATTTTEDDDDSGRKRKRRIGGDSESLTTPSSSSLFGASSKPPEKSTSLFGAAKPAETKSSEASKFNFGAPKTDAKPVEASKFDFGVPKTDSKTSDKPSFNFGGATKTDGEAPEKPVFNFGGQTKTDDKAPAKPAFNFGGAKPAEKTTDGPVAKADDKPAGSTTFTFGGAKPAENSGTPSFSFGSAKKPATDKPTPSFSFGKPVETSAPLTLLFGAAKPAEADKSAAADKPDDAPSSIFGGAKPDDAAGAKPSFTFGAKPATSDKPLFSFGAKPAESTAASTDKPSFSFGSKPATLTDTAALTATKPTTTGLFGTPPATGDTTTSANSTATTTGGANGKPAFSFGASSTEKPAETTTKPLTFGTASPAPLGTLLLLFGNKPDAASTSLGFQFGKATTAPAAGTTPTPDNKPSQPFTFGKAETPAIAPASSTSGIPAIPSVPLFNFGAVQPPTFGGNSAPALGGSTTSTPFANNNAATPAFGQANQANQPLAPAFGSTSAFGSNALTPQPQPQSGGFGFQLRELTPVANPNFKFAKGVNFGTTPGGLGGAANPGGFGNNALVPQFGAQTTPGFGNQGSNGFGGFAVNTNAGFGANNAGGFGGNTNTTPQFNFGGSNNPNPVFSNLLSRQPSPGFGGTPQPMGGDAFGGGQATVMGGTDFNAGPPGERKFAKMRARRRGQGGH